MRVVVNYDLCEANALCMEVAPEVFFVDENDQLQLLVERPEESLRAAVTRAVGLCPRQALAIEQT